MPIRVLFFGATADAVGMRELTIDATGMTAKGVRDKMTAEHPRLAPQKLLLSVNQEYISDEAPLTDGDEVAIFTAVSGG